MVAWPITAAAAAAREQKQQQQQEKQQALAQAAAIVGPPTPEAFIPDLHGPILVRAAPHVLKVGGMVQLWSRAARCWQRSGCMRWPHGPPPPPPPPPRKQILRNTLNPAHRTLPFNDPSAPIEYETELFKGRALVLLKNLPSTPGHAFEGKRRTCYVCVQVRAAAGSSGAEWHGCLCWRVVV